jgi:hypothetical protein
MVAVIIVYTNSKYFTGQKPSEAHKWSKYYTTFNPLMTSGKYYVPPPFIFINSEFCINGVLMFLTVHSDYFLKQR